MSIDIHDDSAHKMDVITLPPVVFDPAYTDLFGRNVFVTRTSNLPSVISPSSSKRRIMHTPSRIRLTLKQAQATISSLFNRSSSMTLNLCPTYQHISTTNTQAPRVHLPHKSQILDHIRNVLELQPLTSKIRISTLCHGIVCSRLVLAVFALHDRRTEHGREASCFGSYY